MLYSVKLYLNCGRESRSRSDILIPPSQGKISRFFFLISTRKIFPPLPNPRILNPMAEYATTLLTILSNQLLLLSTTPYLSPFDIHSLSLSCRTAYNLLAASPSVHRYLDLSVTHRCKDVPRILSAPGILRSTRTLVLDNLPVTTGLLYSLITPVNWQSEIQLLSLRGCKNINEREFMSFLSYLARPSRPEGSLKLKGVYWFSDAEATTGRFVKNSKLRLGSEWTALLKSCEGIISFDTRVCQGHRHDPSFEGEEYLEPKLANIKLEGGCAGCGFTPRTNPKALPAVLVSPAPLFGRAEAACTGTDGKKLGDVLSCEDCVKERWCECCGKWWCDTCAVEKVSLSLGVILGLPSDINSA